MAYKEVGMFEKTPRLYLKRNGEGTISEFVLLDAKQVKSKIDVTKMNTVYTVKYTGKELKAMIAEFGDEYPKFETDNKMSVWGAPILDRKLAECELGHTIRVTYIGEIPSKTRGFSPTPNFKVEEDDGEESKETEKKATPAKDEEIPF